MLIRTATSEDLYDIIQLNTALFHEDGGQLNIGVNTAWASQEGEEYFANYLKKKDAVVFVAQSGDEQIVGYLAGFVKPDATWRPVKSAELDSMFVLKEYRSQGVGTMLVDEFKKWLIPFKVTHVAVTAFTQNERALAFYKKQGFEDFSQTLEMKL